MHAIAGFDYIGIGFGISAGDALRRSRKLTSRLSVIAIAMRLSMRTRTLALLLPARLAALSLPLSRRA